MTEIASNAERAERAAVTARRVFGIKIDVEAKDGEPAAAAGLRSQMFAQAFADSWSRTALDDRTRSLITVAMLAALGSFDEMKGHVAGALSVGVSPEELIDLFSHVAAYAGTSRGVPGWEVASKVITKSAARNKTA